jgi:hypothetical protein
MKLGLKLVLEKSPIESTRHLERACRREYIRSRREVVSKAWVKFGMDADTMR